MKFMKYVFIIIFFSISGSFVHAESLFIRCSVPRAKIILDSGKEVFTDTEGLVLINGISTGKHLLTITKDGYETIKKEILIKPQLTSIEEVRLSLLNEEVPEIIVISPKVSNENTAFVEFDNITIIGIVQDNKGITSVKINGAEAIIINIDDYNVPNSKENTMKFIGTVSLINQRIPIKIVAINNQGYKAEKSFIIQKKENMLTSYEMDSYALLIGVDDYNFWPDLKNPINDILAVAVELQNNYGFQTNVMINPTKSEILSTIRSYFNEEFASNSELLFLLAGHGYFDKLSKTGYFVASDGENIENDQNFETYIAYPILQNIVTNINCKHIVIILDACFGGTFTRQLALRGTENQYRTITRNEFIERKLSFKTRLLLTSGGNEYVPDGRPGKHSPFMRKMLQGMRDYGGEDGILTVEELMVNYMNYVDPQPYLIEFEQDNEPGSSFLFIAR